jgi:hypothetical protein
MCVAELCEPTKQKFQMQDKWQRPEGSDDTRRRGVVSCRERLKHSLEISEQLVHYNLSQTLRYSGGGGGGDTSSLSPLFFTATEPKCTKVQHRNECAIDCSFGGERQHTFKEQIDEVWNVRGQIIHEDLS